MLLKQEDSILSVQKSVANLKEDVLINILRHSNTGFIEFSAPTHGHHIEIGKIGTHEFQPKESSSSASMSSE